MAKLDRPFNDPAELRLTPTGTKTVYYSRQGVAREEYTPCIGGCGRDFAKHDGEARVDTRPRDPEGNPVERIDCHRDGAINVYLYVNGGFID